MEEKGHLFDKKQLPSENEEKKKPKMSSLSWLLENAAITGSNPFLEYAKFDGKVFSLENLLIEWQIIVHK